ncbi:MAG: double zinc ribbon domain-containing protein [Aggregatilineales bacterium]
MSEKVYEMLWDCQFCGGKHMLGKTHRFCPQCGAPQNPQSRYYPSDDEKVAVVDHVYAGRDRTCSSCGELNSAASDFCQQCGASLEGAEEASVLDAQTRDQFGSFENSGSRDLVKESFNAEMERAGVTKTKNQSSSMNPKMIIGILAAILVIGGGIFYFMTAKEDADLLVTGHEWSREIQIEQYQNATAEGWRNSGAAASLDSASLQGCTRRQSGTNRIPDGETCRTVRTDRGDGTFSQRQQCTTKYRSEPVYDDWCTWRGQRWEYERSAESAGDSVNETPYWAEYNLQCDGQRSVGCERVSQRLEAYTVLYRNEDISYRCDYPQNVWETVSIESLWTGQVGKFNRGSIDCGTIEQR